jgi:hypothetical protein
MSKQAATIETPNKTPNPLLHRVRDFTKKMIDKTIENATFKILAVVILTIIAIVGASCYPKPRFVASSANGRIILDLDFAGASLLHLLSDQQNQPRAAGQSYFIEWREVNRNSKGGLESATGDLYCYSDHNFKGCLVVSGFETQNTELNVNVSVAGRPAFNGLVAKHN